MKVWLPNVVRSPWTVAVLIALYSQWEAWGGNTTNLVGPLWAVALSEGVASVLLAWRRSVPLLVQVGALLATTAPWFVWGASQTGTIALIVMIASYAVGRWANRPATYLGVPVAACWILLQLTLDPLQSGLAGTWAWALWGVGAWAAGAWIRQRVELDAGREAQWAETSRAELAEQRLRIAREVHDVLANSLGVVVVHAEAAEELLSADPARAAESIRRVQSTGRDALREIRCLLGVLRAGDPDGPHPSPVPEGPSLDQVDHLISSVRSAGLPLTVERSGDGAVPNNVGQAVYRVLQEALTNVIRHAGPVATRAVLVTNGDGVSVEVRDWGQGPPIGRPAVTGPGHGIVGMSERVRSIGGTFEAGPVPDGGFRVCAHIPLASSSMAEAERAPAPRGPGGKRT